MKNKTQKIKEKIAEYVEEVIKEVWIDCEICSGKGYTEENKKMYTCNSCGGRGNELVEKYRDISLSDVLIALNEKGFRIESDENPYITITPNDKTSEYWGKYVRYELNQPLENQSEDLRFFLYELLCK